MSERWSLFREEGTLPVPPAPLGAKARAALLLGPPVRCHLCGEPLTWTTAVRDHVLPESRGGGKLGGNLQWACHPCNALKGNLTMAELVDRCRRIVTRHGCVRERT